ncbi:MAG: hypothetical protein AAB482_04160, partial [Patescibacteria group bacterium]
MNNGELYRLYRDDQDDRRRRHPSIVKRDRARLVLVRALYESGSLNTAVDCYRAAMIAHHGEGNDDLRLAFDLALSSMELHYRPARWLTAAITDR